MGPINHLKESLWLAGISGGVESSPPCSEKGRMGQAAQGHVQLGLNISKDGDSKTALGNLFLRLITFTVKKFSPVSETQFSMFLCPLACDTEPEPMTK